MGSVDGNDKERGQGNIKEEKLMRKYRCQRKVMGEDGSREGEVRGKCQRVRHVSGTGYPSSKMKRDSSLCCWSVASLLPLASVVVVFRHAYSASRKTSNVHLSLSLLV